jgi:hypothetical protein
MTTQQDALRARVEHAVEALVDLLDALDGGTEDDEPEVDADDFEDSPHLAGC